MVVNMYDVVTNENEIIALNVSYEEGKEIMARELEHCHLEEVDEVLQSCGQGIKPLPFKYLWVNCMKIRSF